MEIKHKNTGEVLFKSNKEILREVIEEAVLSYADLSYANLSYADLSSADLISADLSSADLSYANLRYADLSSADLSYADLVVFQAGRYTAYISSKTTRIGCHNHKSEMWINYEPKDVKPFASDAEEWWTRWGDTVKGLIKIRQKLFNR